MAKQKKNEPTPPTPVLNAREETEDLPTVSWIGWTRTPKGYLVMSCKTQGRVVVDEEVLSGDAPVSRMEAENRIRVEVTRRYLLPGQGDN